MTAACRLLARPIDAALHATHRKATRAFRAEIGALPQILLPVSYSDKMFWRRVFDRNPAFVAHCDKLATKRLFVQQDVAVAELLWSGTDPAALPDALRHGDVVVKMNAACDRNWFFRHRDEDSAAFEATCRGWLEQTFGVDALEWAYGAAPKRLLAERVLADDPRGIDEIKVHLFSGEVFYALIYRGEKTPDGRSGIFDRDGRRLRVTNSVVAKDPGRALPAGYRVPDCFGRAIEVARRLAADTDYLRVDFMVVDGKLHGGEITPYPSAGLMTNSDPAVLAQMGRSWDLRRSWFLRTPQTGWRALYQAMLRRHVETLGSDPIPRLA
ncbi:ATP-grasp fold amidoligase family protein [Kaistia nematophila]|uniref:ATP-grasp fold amidoligase family protein n=1 Tax=Kaistia nematophila TaxID=2994654 RepID=A0A9X3DXK1_9HYPH|nr:ATP-grasp fold amidoligase family protein [Kaistia nematophila]MCX5567567.1 ATP-grasp fold amidoligase family protein [Kaistia nematophila]